MPTAVAAHHRRGTRPATLLVISRLLYRSGYPAFGRLHRRAAGAYAGSISTAFLAVAAEHDIRPPRRFHHHVESLQRIAGKALWQHAFGLAELLGGIEGGRVLVVRGPRAAGRVGCGDLDRTAQRSDQLTAVVAGSVGFCGSVMSYRSIGIGSVERRRSAVSTAAW
jgi:hypothetical protein